jgi:hypothetical protein
MWWGVSWVVDRVIALMFNDIRRQAQYCPAKREAHFDVCRLGALRANAVFCGATPAHQK